jgi:hypothetical protein
VGYGALVAAAAAAAEAEALEAGEGQSEEEEGDGDAGEGDSLCCCAGGSGRWWKRVKARIKRELRKLEDTWVEPKASAIRRVVDVWWSRWGALVVLPASLVSWPIDTLLGLATESSPSCPGGLGKGREHYWQTD